MNAEIRSMIEKCERGSGAPIVAIQAIREKYPSFPDRYIAVLREINGFRGCVGQSYVKLWSAEEIIEYNSGYRTDEFAPGVVLIGTNLGGEAFGIDLRTSGFPYVNIPMCPLSLNDLRQLGTTFEEFLKILHRGLFE